MCSRRGRGIRQMAVVDFLFLYLFPSPDMVDRAVVSVAS